ncbi:MAG: response regulator transcription factor [Roseburia sp.]|nr:response regulator transcription factor [Roseburia sp.]
MSDRRVLIVEDDRDISEMLGSFLEENGYEPEYAYDGREASRRIAREEYTMILMDLMLPYKAGEDLIRELRMHSVTPVICLSAKSEMETRLEALRMGADDYLLKPFDMNEVLVRMDVVLRRAGNRESREQRVLSCGKLCLYQEENRVDFEGEEIGLTLKEFLLLKLFMENPKKTFTKANLYESVWQDEYYYEDNTINVHMSNLRNKLKRITHHDYIETVWGIGYRLRGNSG